MSYYDVFNGDADGICSLHQLRLAEPRDATLVTGVKRDIALLRRVPARAGDAVTVLDISADVNRAPLMALLARGATVQYFDHHGSGQVPAHFGLQSFIDTAPDVCTGIIVDRWLGGAYRLWAVVAAFGDNFVQAAERLAQGQGLDETSIAALRDLGECLNYNGYGDTEIDLIMHPAMLYETVHQHTDPFSFIATEPVLPLLRDARRQDMALAQEVAPHATLSCGAVFVLPDAAWSRRVRGSWSNQLASSHPERAHAVLTPDARGGYVVSVRAPLAAFHGANRLCRLFPGGGGREAAAGINHLPRDKLVAFIEALEHAFAAIA